MVIQQVGSNTAFHMLLIILPQYFEEDESTLYSGSKQTGSSFFFFFFDKQNLGKMVTKPIVIKFMVHGLAFEKVSPVLAGRRGSNERKEKQWKDWGWKELKSQRKRMVYGNSRGKGDWERQERCRDLFWQYGAQVLKRKLKDAANFVDKNKTHYTSHLCHQRFCPWRCVN